MISVLEETSLRRFSDIHEEASAIAFSKNETFSRNFSAVKEMKSCH
jgi:hypothetical protein